MSNEQMFVISGAPPRIQNVVMELGKPVGYQQLTVSTSAVALTVPLGANRVLINLETSPVRWRDDSVNPTSTVGMYLEAGSNMSFETNESITAIKFIRDTSATADATLNISYYNHK